MSVTRYDRDGLAVSTFAGPEGCNPNTGGRRCVQVTCDNVSEGGRNWILMSMDHWVDLVCLVRRMDQQGIGIGELDEAEVA